MSPVIILILVIMILMNGVGYFNAPITTPGYRYGNGIFGIVCLIILVLYVCHILPATV